MACLDQQVGAARCPEAARGMQLACTVAAFAEGEDADQTTSVFGGDYYMQTPTMRGVSFSSCLPEVPALERGVSPSGLSPSSAAPWPCALYGDFYAHQGAGVSACGSDAPLQSSFDGVPHLPGAYEPKPLPEDPLFPIESTTVFMSPPAGVCAEDVIADFLQCLRLRTQSTILSVDAADCSVRAKLFGDSDSCTMTATLYRCHAGEYALECQRRYGDCVAFHRAFRQVAAHFQKWVSPEAAQCDLDTDMAAFSRPALPASAAASEAPSAEQPAPPALVLLAPLLAGALPPAETAAALAAAAAAGGSAASAMLGDVCVMEVVRRLMGSEEPDVVHFVSRLLQQLAAAAPTAAAARGQGRRCPELALAQIEQGKGCAAARDAQSLVELAQVAAEAGRRCPGVLVAARAA